MNLQGQFWTPRPLHRAWGHRQVLKPEHVSQNKQFEQVVPPGFMFVPYCITVEFGLAAGDAENTLGIVFETGAGVLLGQSMTEGTQKEGETKTWVFQAIESAVVNKTTGHVLGVLPLVTLEPGDVIKSVTTAAFGGGAIVPITIVGEQFEEDPQHDLAEIEGMALRIRELERKVAESALQVHQ